jgi:hypothetical protein
MSSYVTVPRIVGLVALVVVGSVLYITDKQGASKAVLRYLKSSKSSKTIAWEDLPKSTDVTAPIFMQDHTGSHPFMNMLKKYMLTGTKAADSDEPEANNYNWVRATITPTTNCKGRKKYIIGGMKAGTCIDVGTGGVIITCNDKSVNYYSYSSNKCKGNPVSAVEIGTIGCGGELTDETPWGDFNDDNVIAGTYKKSIEYECLSVGNHEDPSEIVNDHLDIYKGYSDNSCASDKKYIYFEGYFGDTCIPLKVLNGYEDEISVEFKYDTGTTDYPITDPFIYAKIYSESKTCQGAMDTVTMPMTCTDGIRWDYWNSISTDDAHIGRQ